ncbi:hypothetical protein U1Q18_047462 [Sarracenia purpurea var. burkii]
MHHSRSTKEVGSKKSHCARVLEKSNPSSNPCLGTRSRSPPSFPTSIGPQSESRWRPPENDTTRRHPYLVMLKPCEHLPRFQVTAASVEYPKLRVEHPFLRQRVLHQWVLLLPRREGTHCMLGAIPKPLLSNECSATPARQRLFNTINLCSSSTAQQCSAISVSSYDPEQGLDGHTDQGLDGPI